MRSLDRSHLNLNIDLLTDLLNFYSSSEVLKDLKTGRFGTGFSVLVKPKYLTVPFLPINSFMWSLYHCLSSLVPIGFALKEYPSLVFMRKHISSSRSPSAIPQISNSSSMNSLIFNIRLSLPPHLYF